MAKDPILEQSVPTKKMAEELAKIIGCTGSHKIGADEWGPCESPRHLEKLIELGNPAFREWAARQRTKKTIQEFVEMKGKKTKYSYTSYAEAEEAGKPLGCEGAHQSAQGVWRPCNTPEELNAAMANAGPGRSRIIRARRPARRVITERKLWERLRQRGPRGIEALPGGGLVSGKDDIHTSCGRTRGNKQANFPHLSSPRQAQVLLTKREYTSDRRAEYAKRGYAMPDGSFPIRDVGDLRNAIQAHGRARDIPAARRHIMKRARALGHTDLIPKAWMKRRRNR